MAQILQDLSYKVCSTMLPNFTSFGLFILVFGISAIIHQQLVAILRGLMRFLCRRVFHVVTAWQQTAWSIMAYIPKRRINKGGKFWQDDEICLVTKNLQNLHHIHCIFDE